MDSLANRVKSGKLKKAGVWLTMPSLIVMLLTVGYPIVWAFIISLSKSNSVFKGSLEFVGFENYKSLMTNSGFLSAVGHTVFFVVCTIIIELIIGIGIAYILDTRIKGWRIFNLIFALPLMVAPVVSGLQWRWLLADQYGAINNLLLLIGVEGPAWLTTQRWAFTSLLVANVWLATPFCVMVFLSAMTGIPSTYYEAAKIDGASAWQYFWKIMMPLLKPALLTVLVIRTADAFRVFDIVYILTEGGPGDSTEVMSTWIYTEAFTKLNFGRGTAGAFIVMIMVAIISIIFFKCLDTEDTV